MIKNLVSTLEIQLKLTTNALTNCTVAIITIVNMTVITACEIVSRNLIKLYPIMVKYITIETILLKLKKYIISNIIMEIKEKLTVAKSILTFSLCIPCIHIINVQISKSNPQWYSTSHNSSYNIFYFCKFSYTGKFSLIFFL